MTTDSNNEFDSIGLLSLLLKWKKQLVIVFVSTVIISVIVSYLITPKFKSTVILFPAKTSSLSKSLLTDKVGNHNDLLELGDEEEAEQMLQILNSDEIREQICSKYNLMHHYKIKETDNFPRTKLMKEYEDNISFKRTEFQSVRIDVLDKNPDTASMIANDIAALLDSVKNRMQRERAEQALSIVKDEYEHAKKMVKSISDSLTELRKLGIHEYEVQVERYTEYYSKALLEGKANVAKELDQKMKQLAEYGSAYVELRNQLPEEQQKLSELKARFEEAKVDATRFVPHKFVVNKAFPAEKKSYPIRWLIVVVSVISSLLMAALIILAIENINEQKRKTVA
jgi:uncharacterized protein involved in exopolysaccharide biosynthesis